MDPQKKSRADLNSLPTRQYLDQTVNPILLPALKGMIKAEKLNDSIKLIYFVIQSDKNSTMINAKPKQPFRIILS